MNYITLAYRTCSNVHLKIPKAQLFLLFQSLCLSDQLAHSLGGHKSSLGSMELMWGTGSLIQVLHMAVYSCTFSTEKKILTFYCVAKYIMAINLPVGSTWVLTCGEIPHIFGGAISIITMFLFLRFELPCYLKQKTLKFCYFRLSSQLNFSQTHHCPNNCLKKLNQASTSWKWGGKMRTLYFHETFL